MSNIDMNAPDYIPAKKRLQKIAADAYQRAWDAKTAVKK